MNLAAAYARLAASPDFAEQTKLAALRAEHRKQLTDTKAKHDAEIVAIRQELAAARRELNALRARNESYARKLKSYDGIAQLIAAAARTEPVR
jgi:uncharacterized protein involved in exopolysaccharide biosynthesis